MSRSSNPAWAILASLLALTACGPGTPPPSAPSALLAKTLPDFSRPTLDGAIVDTKASRGQVVVVKFFAKYCEPCKRTLPAAEELHRAHPDVLFIGVAEDERATDAREVVDAYRLSFPIVHDVSNILSGRYRVTEMPMTFVANASGQVVWVGGPENTESGLPRAIAAAK
jgi:thiol-disulfide isomerase/thioredoxin